MTKPSKSSWTIMTALHGIYRKSPNLHLPKVCYSTERRSHTMVSTGIDPQLSSFFSLLLLSDDGKVTLARVDSDVFELSHRIYTGTPSALSRYVPHYIKAGVLGDKIGCPIFEICVMLKLVLLYITSMSIFSYSGTHIRPVAGLKLLKWALG